MSKHNNANKNNYDSGRNHPGDGTVYDEQKAQMGQEKARQNEEGSPNFIPGEAPVGEKSNKH
jgi:hypothetical protein